MFHLSLRVAVQFFYSWEETTPFPFMDLNMGDAFREFRDRFDHGRPVEPSIAVRLINLQSEAIADGLESQVRSVNQRRQIIAYLLEQCILLSSDMFHPRGAAHRRRFRRLRRAIERAWRSTHVEFD